MSQHRTSTMIVVHDMLRPSLAGKRCAMAALLISLVLSQACAPVPILSGSHTTLPPVTAPVIVWGNHPAVVTAATSWLQGRGFTLIERAAVQRLVEDPLDEGAVDNEIAVLVLGAAKTLKVDTVVFVHRSGDIRAPLVSVRGVDVESNRILWNGYGHYREFVTQPFSHLLVNLTCQAFAEAWGVPIENPKEPCAAAGPR